MSATSGFSETDVHHCWGFLSHLVVIWGCLCLMWRIDRGGNKLIKIYNQNELVVLFFFFRLRPLQITCLQLTLSSPCPFPINLLCDLSLFLLPHSSIFNFFHFIHYPCSTHLDFASLTWEFLIFNGKASMYLSYKPFIQFTMRAGADSGPEYTLCKLPVLHRAGNPQLVLCF